MFNNSAPRRDINGAVIDAHDGNIIGPIGGLYYMYAVEYGLYTEVGKVAYQPASPQHVSVGLIRMISLLKN